MTQGGGEECGEGGDYVSWEEEDWQLTSQARVEIVGELEKPCRPDSKVTVYTADFQDHSVATNPEERSGCMEHCQKLGNGMRSPPVGTLAEWDWLRKEVHAITPDISVFNRIWLSVTDEKVESQWMDPYWTGYTINPNVTLPWMFGYRDTKHWRDTNCIHWWTTMLDRKCWEEASCNSYDIACPSGCVINKKIKNV